MHEPTAPENSGLDLFFEGGADMPEYARREQSRLMLADLQKTRLSARLVVMSACESGIAGVRREPDEFVGLPAGVLASGAAGAIGTFWSVNDDTAATFTTRFLTAHLNPDGTERMPPAEAFRDTQRWMRNVSASELQTNEAWFWPGRKMQASDAALQSSMASSSRQIAVDVIKKDFVPVAARDQPFKDPHDWAAFTYTGA